MFSGLMAASAGCLIILPAPGPHPPAAAQHRKSWLGLSGQRRPGNLTLCARLIFSNVSSQRLASVPLGLWAGGAVTCAAFEWADSEWATACFEYKHTPFMPRSWHLSLCSRFWVRLSVVAGWVVGRGKKDVTRLKLGNTVAEEDSQLPAPQLQFLSVFFLRVPRVMSLPESGACSPTGGWTVP